MDTIACSGRVVLKEIVNKKKKGGGANNRTTPGVDKAHADPQWIRFCLFNLFLNLFFLVF